MTSKNMKNPDYELPPKILGLSGTVGSGKDTLAAWLNQNYSYYHIPTSDMIREMAQVRYGNIEWPTLQKTANELRAEQGGGVLVDLALEHFKAVSEQYPGGLIVSGIRSIGEAKAIKAHSGYLLFIDATSDTRYERVVERGRGDEQYFKRREATETEAAQIDDESVQNLAGVQQLADAVMFNDHTLEKFLEDIRLLLELPKRSS